MKIFKTCNELVAELAQQSAKVGFVPTMGALHAGHVSLVEQARKSCDTVVVSVFVNPTQFNDPKDLENYPRTLEADALLLEAAGADIVFAPTVDEIYPQTDNRIFDFGLIDKVLEGAMRPGHFNGVAQVVSRLFDIVKPNLAFFGEKDFQQLAIIRELVSQLELGIEIVGCPIIRAESGLALSSRNTLLKPEHLEIAPLIYKTLSEATEMSKTQDIETVKKYVLETINSSKLLEVEYFEIVNADSFEDVSSFDCACNKRGCIAVYAGEIRLIDNIKF
ncbi:MAG: pantoate--beta-alanine ligase [Rikenellaceae bacterium]